MNKLQLLRSTLLLSTLSAASSQAMFDDFVPPPVCAKFAPIKFLGDAEFVNTDNSFGEYATTGDMSIGQVYSAQLGPNYPNQFPVFANIFANFKSVCVTTFDQIVPNFGAPTCFYEFQIGFCRVNSAIIYPPLEEIKKVSREEVISEEKILYALEKGDSGRKRRTQRDTFATDQAKDVVAKDDGEDLVDAFQIDDKFAKNNEALVAQVCPNLGCWCPAYFDCKKGGFTAHGSGPDPIEITGGTRGLFGAFGQIITPTDFDIGTMSPLTGDLSDSSIAMQIEICYYNTDEIF
mmetsp:Transcript_14315/g.20843  ORF Transcript_14315/g.20843 Transcript_14315/m.20843 type:complete len:291 (+) Transcript_14315:246-1118(+)